MKAVLVTTTINVPDVLRAYRHAGPDVPFIIAGDRKAPHQRIAELCDELGNACYLTPEEQQRRWPGVSNAIGWDSIQRRNLAILAAAEMKPDVIVTVDDDNIPRGSYFTDLEESFKPYAGVMASGEWANIGVLAEEPYTYRGYPYSIPSQLELSPNGRPHQVGVVNGLIFGDPDINATERLENDPSVRRYDRDEVGVDPKATWAPINSQNTAWRTELAPLMFVMPEVGRYDDIWSSYIAERVLAATDWNLLYGRPYVTQERNDHDLIKDVEDELYGMRHTDALIRCLGAIEVNPKDSVLGNLTRVLGGLRDAPFALPHRFFREWVAAWS